MNALKPIKNQAYQIVIWQLIIIVALALLLFIFRGVQHGISALLGGLAYWVPAFVFVWRVFARASIRAAKQFIAAFFAGEAIKLLFSAALFLLIVKYLPVNVVSVLTGFAGAIIAFWVSSIIFLNRQQGMKQ